MNSSPRVNPEDCRTCGECCKSYKIFYPPGLNREKYDDMIRILYSDGINAHIEQEGLGNWLVFDHPCRYLQQDEEGKYSCGLYDEPERPLICSLFPYADTTKKDCPHLRKII